MLSAPSPIVPAPAPAHAPASASSENVYHALAEWTARASGRLLTAWAIAGWLDAVGVAVLLPRLWLLALPFLTVSSIGVWGLASRGSRALEAAPQQARFKRRALQVVRTAAVVVGTLAAIIAFYGAFLLALGRRWGGPGG